NGVIELKEKEKIQAAETRSEQIERLLDIIKWKEGHQPFQKLLEILKAKKYLSLVQKIKDTETQADPNMKLSVNPNANNELISSILRTHFTEALGASTLLNDIRELLKQKKVFPGGKEWNNDDLSKFLTKEFVGIQVVPVSKWIKGKPRLL
ncbi:Sterile alpha motif domain-containing protein 9, partial [Biomphalaria glabrata]